MKCYICQPDGGNYYCYDEHIPFQISSYKPEKDLGKNKITKCKGSEYDKTYKAVNSKAEKIRYVKRDTGVCYKTLYDICEKKSCCNKHRHGGNNYECSLRKNPKNGNPVFACFLLYKKDNPAKKQGIDQKITKRTKDKICTVNGWIE
jgi:hypothetical protein